MYFNMKTRIMQGAAALIAAGSLIAGAACVTADAAELEPEEPKITGQLVIPARLDGWEREMWDVICRRDNERLLAEKYGRTAAADPEPEEEPAEDPEPERVYLGRYKITGYDTCPRCCGNSRGITASGTQATVGRTCAAGKDLPFGTVLYIEGIGTRVVEDRGGAVNGGHIDVLCSDHPECYSITGYYDVYMEVQDD